MDLGSGGQSVTFDIFQNRQLGGNGMAYYSQENLPRFQRITPLNPLPASPTPYKFTH